MNKLLEYVRSLEDGTRKVSDVQESLGEIASFYSRKMLSSEELLTGSNNDVNNIINDACTQTIIAIHGGELIGESSLKDMILIQLLEAVDTLDSFK